MKKSKLYISLLVGPTILFVTPLTIACSNNNEAQNDNLKSYKWLNKLTKEIPNRKAGNNYNSDDLFNTKKGEKYASSWIVQQLKNMNYKEFKNDDDLANSLPSNINYDVNNVAFNSLNSSKKQEYMNFDGFYLNQFYWRKGTLVDQKSQNVILNIKSTKDNISKDFYIVSHYDTKNVNNDATNDNSSGLATNLAIADFFSKKENRDKLNVNLHLIFAGAEEEGVLGTWAWSNQYLDNTTKSSIIGMINLDSVAGGDYLYVHSPNTKNAQPDWNTSSKIRDEINSKSNNKITIHPYILGEGINPDDVFKKGETGDWSDHAPFYKKGITVAYIESTNFLIRGENGYDGYSQVINPYYWTKEDQSSVKLIPKKVKDGDGNDIIVYEPENFDMLVNDTNFTSWGKLWHMDWDKFDVYEQNFPGRLKEQMSTVYKTIIDYILELK